MDFLPPELLSRIFSFLHIEDRKSVRLVCRDWNHCCNCPSLVKREKFVFRAGYHIGTINSFLENCSRFRSTIEFQGLELHQLSNPNIWQQFGEKILSLSLIECRISSETIRDIFLHCLNMHSFKLTSQYRFVSYSVTDVFCSPEMLDELIRHDVERRKMTTLQLFVNGLEIAKDVLRRVFKIFPCVRNFGTGYSSYTNCIIPGIYYCGSLYDSFNPALIKELSFNVPSSGLWLQEFASVRELKLQKLETILRYPEVPRDIFQEFLSNQTELRTVKMALLDSDEDYSKMILFEILSLCSNLIDFRFKCDAGLKTDEFFQLFKTVSRSNFHCLMVWFKYLRITDDEFFDDDLSAYLTPWTNESLRVLKLDAPVLDDYSVPILKHFSNLQHLELATVSDKILQTIFQYLVHLQTLVLHKTDSCTTFGFTGRHSNSTVSENQKTYSISCLRELRHLELDGFLSCRWIEQTVLEFNFPQLRYLRLSLWRLEEKISKQIFEYLPEVIPSVEVLILGETPLHGCQCAYFCKNFKRLRLLLYSWFDEDSDESIEKLFLLRPTLKYAVDLSDTAFFYDCFTKKLRRFNFKDMEFKRSVFYDSIRS